MSIVKAVTRAAQINPHGTAVVHEGNRQSWSKFASKISRIAGGLRSLGFLPGERVAVLAANVPEHFESAMAIMWSGLVLVPINTRLSAFEQIQILRHADCAALLFDGRNKARGEEIARGHSLRAAIEMGNTVIDGNYRRLASHEPITPCEAANSAAAAIFYTGGTTGAPKGAEISHGAFMIQSVNMMHDIGFDMSSVYMHTTPLFHLASFGGGLAVTYAAGANSFLPEFSMDAILDSIEADGTNSLTLVPTMMATLLDGTDPNRSHLLKRIRFITYGAAPVPPVLLRLMLKEMPSVSLIQFYGQTELTGVCTVLEPKYHVLDGPMAGKVETAGRATATCAIRIVDDAGREIPRGAIGEIVVDSPGAMSRYWRDPVMTAATIRDGWLHTGDLGRMDSDGFVSIVGRIKDMIISGGENIFAGEVENALLSHPEVAASAVIGVPDKTWGERVHAFVVPKLDSNPAPTDLIAHCRSLIAGYKCPKSVTLRREPLPVSGVGKVRKIDLLDEWRRDNVDEPQ
jgi:long-chain acyl-CoA synthetase